MVIKRHGLLGIKLRRPTQNAQNQDNSLSLNMAAHMASRELRMRGFYYDKITNDLTTIEAIPYSVKINR